MGWPAEEMAERVGFDGDETASACVIWFHGLGDTPHGWADLCRNLSQALPHVRWILPCAPRQPVTCNGGAICTSWMDLETIPIAVRTPDSGRHMQASLEIVEKIVTRQLEAGIKSDRIVLAGFSQGA